ncbi:MAG: dipeptidase [Candidatus Binatia bacterium]
MYLHVACEIALALHFYMADALEANDGSQRFKSEDSRTVTSMADRNVIERQNCCSTDPSISRRGFLRLLATGIAGMSIDSALVRAVLGDNTLLAEAAEISKETITVDLHCHPNALRGSFPRLDPDVPASMNAGGLDAGLFAARGDYPLIRRNPAGRRYESRKPREGELLRRSTEQLDKILEAAKEGKMALARSPAEIMEAKKRGAPCAVLAIEGSDPLEGDLARVKLFYDRGVRILQLMHYRINEIGDIQTEKPQHNGLTPFGRGVVREMNKLGMVIDTAHCSAETLEGVLSESKFPVIFSHTGAYALRPLARHLADKERRAIAAKGGIIGIWPHLRRRDTFDNFLKDIDYVQKSIGADHVGIATDLFGLDTRTAIPTHKEFPLIPAALLKRGYTDGVVEKIIGGNFMRLFREVVGSSS